MSEKFTYGRIVGRTDYTDRLFSLRFEAEIEPFEAGQFCRVGVHLAGADGLPMLEMRPYSFVNAPAERPYEIILTKVERSLGGVVSPALADLKVGDTLCVGPRPNGFFSMPEVPSAEVLWGLCTGTAIGPYLSMMKTDAPWQKFNQIVLVHAVRTASELSYQMQIEALMKRYGNRLIYIPMVSREVVPGAMSGRIPEAITNGSLALRAGLPLRTETGHAMICGNPDMVADTIKALETLGMKKHRRKTPGQITTEAYW